MYQFKSSPDVENGIGQRVSILGNYCNLVEKNHWYLEYFTRTGRLSPLKKNPKIKLVRGEVNVITRQSEWFRGTISQCETTCINLKCEAESSRMES